MNQAVTELKKHPAVPWTECFILSLPLLLTAFYLIDLSLWLELIIFILLFNIALYFVLKDKYDLESNVLPYGIVFAVIFVVPFLTLLSFAAGNNPKPPFPYLGIFYIIPFTALFYVFALFLLNKKKDTNKADFNKTVSYLIIAAALFFIIVSVYFIFSDVPFSVIVFFEIVLLLVFLISSGIIYLIIDKRRSLRKFVWVLFFCFIIETVVATTIRLMLFASSF